MPKRKKRPFMGNRWTGPLKITVLDQAESENNDPVNPVPAPVMVDAGESSTNVSASGAKIDAYRTSVDCPDIQIGNKDILEGYRFFDIQKWVSFMEQFPCPKCRKSTVYLFEETQTGLASKIKLTCEVCSAVIDFESSSFRLRKDTQCDELSKKFEINTRFALAMFGIGRHYVQAKRFCGSMNLSPPVGVTTWNKIKSDIHTASK